MKLYRYHGTKIAYNKIRFVRFKLGYSWLFLLHTIKILIFMINWFEKRRHHRLSAALQLFYERTGLTDIKPELHKGYTENISMGGLYFISQAAPIKNLNVDDILSINIKIPRHNYDLSWTNTLQARGKIVRIEECSDRPESYGVALKFLEDLRFINS
jgi:hypothetical protein